MEKGHRLSTAGLVWSAPVGLGLSEGVDHMSGTSLEAIVGAKSLYVDSSALECNLREVRKMLAPRVRLLAVVKGDGYGAGAVEVSRVFLAAGADCLGVSSVTEGVELRRAGIRAPVFVMSPILKEECPAAVEHQLEIAVASRREIEELAACARRLGKMGRVHLEVETGLGRTGADPEEVPSLLETLDSLRDTVRLEGIFTHMSEAHRREAALRQFSTFQKVAGKVPAGTLRHVANSATLLNFPEMHLDMVRVGTLLYGQFPFGTHSSSLNLKSAWEFRAKVVFLHEVAVGRSVGYGGEYVAKRPTKIAVVAAGYADGFGLTAVSRPKDFRDLVRYVGKMILSYLGKGRGEGGAVAFECGVAPVVGRIGMQLTMVDVTKLPVKVGDEAKVVIRPTAGARLPRVYLKGGVPYLVRTPWGEEVPVEKALLPSS